MNDTSLIALAESLIDSPSAVARKAVARTLSRFGSAALRLASRRGITVVLLNCGERFTARSPRLRELAPHVDSWPTPPAGLFVVEERTAYLRSRSPLAAAHEFGHGLDCALGNGAYLSSSDAEIRRLFAEAPGFVTPYAATAPDEWLAENLRALTSSNDSRSPWPTATPERLEAMDPAAYAYFRNLFEVGFERALRSLVAA